MGTYFIDGPSNDTGGIHDSNTHQAVNASFSSAQQVNLAVLIYLLQLIHIPLRCRILPAIDIPGFTVHGNKQADALTCPTFTPPVKKKGGGEGTHLSLRMNPLKYYRFSGPSRTAVEGKKTVEVTRKIETSS